MKSRGESQAQIALALTLLTPNERVSVPKLWPWEVISLCMQNTRRHDKSIQNIQLG